MLMAASWPSNNEAAVTNLSGVSTAVLRPAFISEPDWSVAVISGWLFILFTTKLFSVLGQGNKTFVLHALQITKHDFQVSAFAFQFLAFLADAQ